MTVHHPHNPGNDIDIDTAEYNRRTDTLDEEIRQMEREAQQREILAMIEQAPTSQFVHSNFTFPTSYFEDYEPQALGLGDLAILLGILRRYGIVLEYGPPLKEAKIVGLVIGLDWTEVTLEWELE